MIIYTCREFSHQPSIHSWPTGSLDRREALFLLLFKLEGTLELSLQLFSQVSTFKTVQYDKKYFFFIEKGFLCKYGFAGGWPSVFYVFGIAGVVCFFLWMYTIYDSPDKHPRILQSELKLIKQTASVSSTNVEKRKNIPWVKIWLSMPVWAISVAKFCGAWGNLMLMSKLPSYLNTMLHVSIQNVSLEYYDCDMNFNNVFS